MHWNSMAGRWTSHDSVLLINSCLFKQHLVRLIDKGMRSSALAMLSHDIARSPSRNDHTHQLIFSRHLRTRGIGFRNTRLRCLPLLQCVHNVMSVPMSIPTSPYWHALSQNTRLETSIHRSNALNSHSNDSAVEDIFHSP